MVNLFRTKYVGKAVPSGVRKGNKENGSLEGGAKNTLVLFEFPEGTKFIR